MIIATTYIPILLLVPAICFIVKCLKKERQRGFTSYFRNQFGQHKVLHIRIYNTQLYTWQQCTCNLYQPLSKVRRLTMGVYCQLLSTERRSLLYISFSFTLFLHSQHVFSVVRANHKHPCQITWCMHSIKCYWLLQRGLCNWRPKQVFTGQKTFCIVVFNTMLNVHNGYTVYNRNCLILTVILSTACTELSLPPIPPFCKMPRQMMQIQMEMNETK